MSRSRCIRLLGLLLLIFLPESSPLKAGDSSQPVHAFVVGKLWPGNSAPITDAVLLVADGKILKAGPASDVSVPKDAVRHTLPNAVVVPGFVIAETSMGVGADDERTLTPEIRAVDGFDLFADYSTYLKAGITSVQISPGRQRLMPGQGAVVKLAGEDPTDRILSKQESLRVVLNSDSANVPHVYEPPVGAVSVDNPLAPTRPQIAQSLGERVAGLRVVLQAALQGAEPDDSVVDLDALRKALQRGRLRIKANTDSEIRASLNLYRSLQKQVDRRLNLVLTDPMELKSFKNQLPDWKAVSVILNTEVRPGQLSNPAVPKPGDEEKPRPWDLAKLLIDGGLGDRIALHPPAGSNLDDLLFVSSLIQRGGATADDVLKMLTANPAAILGVEDRIGSLQPGKDADFVVLSGEPFAGGTFVRSTWVDGQSVYNRETSDQTTLIEAAAVYTSGGHKLPGGSVLVGNKKIQAVGTSVSRPDDADVRRFPTGVIVPGFVDLGTGLGFGGSVSRISLSTKLGDRLAIDDPTMAFARQGGITTAVFANSGSPSPMLAFKLGDTPRLLKEPVAIRFSMPANLTSGVPGLRRTLATAKAYAAAWQKYEVALTEYKTKLKSYEAALAKYEAIKKASDAKKAAEQKKAEAEKSKAADAKKSPAKESDVEAKNGPSEKKPDDKTTDDKTTDSKSTSGEKTDSKTADAKTTQADKSKDAASSKSELKPPVKPTEPKKPKSSSTYEPYRALMAGKIPAVVSANSVNSIKAAVKLFREEFQLKMILTSADNAYRLPDLLARHKVQVSVGPSMIREVDGRSVNLAQICANHQIPFAFQSNATSGVQQLPMAVQYSVYHGLGAADALNGLTNSAASLLSLDGQIGTLEEGKDADLVVLSGPPFEASSQVLAVMIDGAWVYERGASQ